MQRVPDQPATFQGLANQRPLNIILLGTVSGYDDDIDEMKHLQVTIRQSGSTTYTKPKKLFD